MANRLQSSSTYSTKWSARLSAHEVIEIRMYYSMGVTQQWLGLAYGVSSNTIYKIVSFLSWKGVKMSMKHIRDYYGVPAFEGKRVRYTDEAGNSKEGTIVRSNHQYLEIDFPCDRLQGSNSLYHPTYNLEYLDPPGDSSVCMTCGEARGNNIYCDCYIF